MDSRRFDGKPETERDARFFDLRASGYTGPIDQDGNRVDDMDAWIAEHRDGGERSNGTCKTRQGRS